MASVRFICGTQSIHTELERRISEFLGTEDTILYSSCFDANAGLFESLLSAEDAVISDELNHASVIDGIRLCKAQPPAVPKRRHGRPRAVPDRGGGRPPPADRDRRRLLDGRLPGRPARHLRPGRAARRARHGRRLARGRVRRPARPRHARALRRGRPRRRHHRDAREGDGRRVGRLRVGPARDRRDPAPAVAPLPLLEQPGAADRRRGARHARPARVVGRAAHAARREHGLVPRADGRAPGSRCSRASTRSCR